MASVIVLYDSHDSAYAGSFIRAAQLREPGITFDARDQVAAFALDASTLTTYDALIALLSPEALASPAIVRLFVALESLADRRWLAAILRPVALPDTLHPSQVIQAESLDPESLARILFPALGNEATPDGWPLDRTRGGPPVPPADEPSYGGYGERSPISGAMAPPPPAAEEEPAPSGEWASRGGDFPPPPPPQAAPPPAPGAPPPAPPPVQAAPPPQPKPRRPPAAPPPDVIGAQPSAPPAARDGTSPASETLQFSTYHPNEAAVDSWQTLLVYTHLADHLGQVQADAGTFIELGSAPIVTQGQSLRKIARNVEISIEPHAEGVTFSPAQDSFIWRGDWHRSLFRYSGAKALAGTTQKGWIDVYADRISPICTIEVSFSFHDGIPSTSLSAPPRGMAVTSSAFDTVFISYSHRDHEAMQQALETYQKMNITVYHDDQLPSGVNYERELARMIQAANVFHLLWSATSAQSPEVRKEWLQALAAQKGERFIRPWYWQQPLVTPPEELQERRISFRYEHLRRRLLRPATWL